MEVDSGTKYISKWTNEGVMAIITIITITIMSIMIRIMLIVNDTARER